jgi:hypothetical protein
VKVKQNVKPLIVFPGVKRTEFSMNLWWLNSYWYLVAGRSAGCWAVIHTRESEFFSGARN